MRIALGLLVSIAVSMTLAGCIVINIEEEDLDANERVEVMRTETRVLELDGRALSLATYNGTVTVRATDDTEATVQIDLSARGSDRAEADRRLSRIDIRAFDTRTAVVLEVQSPDESRTGAHLTILVPALTPVSARTTNGSIVVTDLQEALDLITTNGSIDIVGAQETVEAETVNGSVDVAFDRFDARTVRLVTTNGNVDLRIPAAVDADVDARTTNGRVETPGVTFTRVERTQTVSGERLTGQLGDGGASVTLRTTNGTIRLRTP